MTPYMQIEGLTKSFGDLVLFNKISFGVAEGQRIGLIAKNGSGKTTLLNIISGKEGYDEGTVSFRRDLKVGYLEQDPHYPEDLSVIEACFHHGNSTIQLIKEYEECIETEGNPGMEELLVRMEHEKAWPLSIYSLTLDAICILILSDVCFPSNIVAISITSLL